jgi:hypothetical protein
MEKLLELITKWMRQSGLKVNDEKTEFCHSAMPPRNQF